MPAEDGRLRRPSSAGMAASRRGELLQDTSHGKEGHLREQGGDHDSAERAAVLSDYDARRSLFEALGRRVSTLIEELLDERRLRVHSVSYRVKDKGSLERKLGRTPDKYASLEQVTDVLGLRIITYFPDEVDMVADLIEQEFRIDAANSVDRRATMEPDRFGYLSLHYVATVSEERGVFTEYKRFAEDRFEVQIRSILQHAWAEIEHDLGYKTQQAIPRPLRRRFSRLAGLLEMADEEFCHIRDELTDYEHQVEIAVRQSPGSVYLDKDSLTAFMAASPLMKEIDEQLAASMGGQILPGKSGLGTSGEWAERYSVRLQQVGLQTISELEDQLMRQRDRLQQLAPRWYEQRPRGTGRFIQGISILYLTHLLALDSKNDEELQEHLITTGTSPDEVRAMVASLRQAYVQLDS